MRAQSMAEDTTLLYLKDEDLDAMTEQKYAEVMDSIQSSCKSMIYAARSKMTSGIFGVDNCVMLNGKQKCTLAAEGLETLEHEFQAIIQDCTSILSDYEVSLEDLAQVLKRIKKQRERLDREVVPILRDRRKKTEFSFAFLHFYNNAMHELTSAEQRLVHSNEKYRARLREIEKINRESELHGYRAQVIDVDEMRINVKDSLRGMRESRAQCHWTKVISARTIHTLEKSKQALKFAIKTSIAMEKKHQLTTAQNKDICDTIVDTNQDLAEERYIMDVRKQGLKSYDIRPPSVADVINTYNENVIINRQKKVEEKNLHMAKRTFEHHRRLWSEVKRLT